MILVSLLSIFLLFNVYYVDKKNYINKYIIILTILFLNCLILINNKNYFLTHKYLWFVENNQYYIGFKNNIIDNNIIVLILIITTTIIIYSLWYMKNDFNIINFLIFMFIFSIAMILAIESSDLIILFFWWEMVGIISFLLINFWSNRIEANKSWLKAIFINKFGDINLLYFIIISWILYQSINLNIINILNYFMIWTPSNYIRYSLYWLIFAAITKSWQIILSSWLTDAIEGPTPVSALPHSATMVGIGFLVLFKFSNCLEYTLNYNEKILLMIFWLLTIIISSFSAWTNYDIKAILWNSTSAQLGYMFLTFISGQIHWSLLHFTTHAFYKALLFLTMGYLIHTKDSQDLRWIAIGKTKQPFIMFWLIIGFISLIGLPSTFGSFSKEYLIMQNIYDWNINNFIIVYIFLIGLILTITYGINFLINIENINIGFKKIKNNTFQYHNISILIIITLGFLTSICIIGIFTLSYYLNYIYSIDINNIYLERNWNNLNFSQFIEYKNKIIPNIFIFVIIIIIINYKEKKYNFSEKFNYINLNNFYDKIINNILEIYKLGTLLNVIRTNIIIIYYKTINIQFFWMNINYQKYYYIKNLSIFSILIFIVLFLFINFII